MNIEQLYLEYKSEIERIRQLDVQIGEYYIKRHKPEKIMIYDTNELTDMRNVYEQLLTIRNQHIIKMNQLIKEIADILNGRIFKLSNGNYIAYDDNTDIVECRIREYEEYVP